MTYVHIYTLDGQLNPFATTGGAIAGHAINKRLILSDGTRPAYGSSIEVPAQFRPNNFSNAVQVFPTVSYIELSGPITNWRPNGATPFFSEPAYSTSNNPFYAYIYSAWTAPANTNTPLMINATETVAGSQIVEWFFVFSKSPTSPLGNPTMTELLENVQSSQWSSVIPSGSPIGTSAALGLDALPGTGEGGGNQVLTAQQCGDTLLGGDGDDDITGSACADRLEGGDGKDTIRGAAGNDTIFGGAGSDLIFGGDDNDLIYGGNEISLLVSQGDRIFGGAGNDTIDGGQGNDFLDGGAGDDVVNGGEGNDTIVASTGQDWIIGGPGTDTLLIPDTAGTLDLRTSTISGIERLVFSMPASVGPLPLPLSRVAVIADSVASALTEIVFAARQSQLSPLTETVRVHMRDSQTLDLTALTLTSMEARDRIEIRGGAWSDTITGADGHSTILGNEGNDLIFGGAAGNLIGGGTGNDTIRGGMGNDTIYGGLDNDNIGGGAGNDLIFGVAGANIIWGGLGDDTVQGGSSRDTIFGGGDGSNQLLGNDGDDLIFAGMGGDLIGGGAGNDTVRGGIGNDTIYGGLDNDDLAGGSGDDVIFGAAGNNVIWGGLGRDTIHAGTGKDIMNGGPGADTFVFASATHIGIGAGRDVITDFTRGQDRIDLTALNTTFNGTGGMTGGGQASFYYFAAGGLLIGDQTGNGAADWVIELAGAPGVGAGDFIL